MKGKHKIAIIGAGMAGIAAARAVSGAGAAVTIFDKGRQPGGRLATRQTQGFTFNHGCQFFTRRDSGFAAATAPFSAVWPQAGEARFAGNPTMASLAAALLPAGVDLHQHAQVSAIARAASGWRVSLGDTTAGPFDTLILAIPAPQAASVLAGHPFAAALADVVIDPCWALMIGFADAAEGPAVIQTDGAISWAARENARPGAPPAPSAYTIHASAEWSSGHLDNSPEQITNALSREFFAATNIPTQPVFIRAHRWRYAKVSRALGQPFLWDSTQRLGLCGDWCLGGRLEAAYLSGHALGISLTHDL
jgi:predicted NAD/FAD-dependent oxidoreductase